MSDLEPNFIEEIFDEFIEEANELLMNLDNMLSTSTITVENTDLLASVMRIMHSMKGMSGMAGCNNLTDLAHQLEDMIVNVQNDKIVLTNDIVDYIFEGIDYCKDIVERASRVPEENILTDEELTFVDKIKAVNISGPGETKKTSGSGFNFNNQAKYFFGKDDITDSLTDIMTVIKESCNSGGNDETVNSIADFISHIEKKAQIFFKADDPIFSHIDQFTAEKDIFKNEMPDVLLMFIEDFKNSFNELITFFVSFTKEETDDIPEYLKRVDKDNISYLEIKEVLVQERKEKKKLEAIRKPTPPPKKVEVKAKKEQEKILRVPQNKIDVFMMSIGSLIIKSDSLEYFYDVINEKNRFDDNQKRMYRDTIRELNKTIFDLQKHLMEIRKFPVSGLFNKFFTLVRKTSKIVGKKIELKLEGEQTQVDASILNELEPVLTHMIRNSVDHGIEPASIRKNNNKSEKGTIILRAEADDEFLYLKVMDDGGGIDVEKIKAIALKKNMKSAEELEKLSKPEALQLIFLPGFSSAEKVSEVSGRGVGMDVVNTTLQLLNGRCTVDTELGQGSTIELVIPQVTTLVTKKALIISAENLTLAFFEEDIECTLEITGKRFIHYRGNTFFNYNDQIIPVFYLNRVLGIKENVDFNSIDTEFKLVVTLTDMGYSAVIVDDFSDYQTIVVKDFEHNMLVNIAGVKGYTITGKGDVVLIGNPNDLILQSKARADLKNTDRQTTEVAKKVVKK